MDHHTTASWRRPAILSLAIALALGSTATLAADAAATPKKQQDKKDEKIETIQVSGIRGSIKESLDIKQNATGVVDLIVADDIGKFPDENLAEALQRVPGITITRNGGEGQNILVRGLGGDYNITTLNGRKLASDFAGRDFNFDTIASELVNVLQVYKSPEARLTEGGIGAVVDIETRRPLDQDQTTLSASAKGIYESRTQDVQPHASFIAGINNLDNTMGVLFSAVYSKRTLRADTYSAEGFFDEDEGWGLDSAAVPVDMNNNGSIDANEKFASKIPSYMYFANAQDVRERIGSTLAFQWKASDDLDVNLDALYSRYNTDGDRFQIGFVNYDEDWTPGTPVFSNAKFDSLNRVVKMRQTGANTMVELLNISEPRKTDTYQLGGNVKYALNKQWTLTADAAYSQAKNQNAGDNRFIVARGFVDSIDIDYSTGHMLPDVVINPGLTAEQDYGAHYSYNSGTGITDKVTDLKLHTEYVPDSGIISKITTGLNYVRQSKGQSEFASTNPSQFSRGGYYLTRDGYTFDNSTVFNKGEFSLFRIPKDVFVPANFDHFMDGEGSITPQPWPSFDYDKLLAYYRSINQAAADKSIVASMNKAGTYDVTEAVSTVFSQVQLEPVLFGFDTNLNMGLRANRTKVTSSGYGYSLDKVVLDSNGQPTNNAWRTVTPVSFEQSYTDVLPSMNFSLNLTDSLKYRFSAARVMSRAGLYQLRPWASPNFNEREQGLPTLSSGNPSLTPEKANQADMTVEWYYADSSALSGGVFIKDIQSFITDSKVKGTVAGVNYLQNLPTSGQYGAKIKGFEMAWQHALVELPEPFDGLGFQVNYTYVDSAYDDPALKAKNLPFAGMSKNSYNAVVYYEKYGFQTRLAYNWRSKFVSYPDAWGGAAWVSDYGQLDASASYEFNKSLGLFVEASNLTNSRYWGYVKREDQVNYLERFGTQIAVGIRGSF